MVTIMRNDENYMNCNTSYLPASKCAMDLHAFATVSWKPHLLGEGVGWCGSGGDAKDVTQQAWGRKINYTQVS